MPDGNAFEGQFERKEEESLRPWPEALFKLRLSFRQIRRIVLYW